MCCFAIRRFAGYAATMKIVSILSAWMPGLGTLLHYRRDWLRADARAGLSVAAVALPVGVAYAELAGMSPVAGLYASVLPMMVYALFGTSRQLIVGPDAATCAMVAATLVPIARGNAELYISLSVTLAFLTGALCLIASRLKLGFLADLLSRPILLGFLNGVAISIVVGQLGKVFGFQYRHANLLERLGELPGNLWPVQWPVVLVALAALGVLWASNRWLPRLPSALAAMVVCGLGVWLLGLDQRGVAVVGPVPAGLPQLHWPSLPLRNLGELLGAAAALALVSFNSAMLTARSFAAKNRYDVDADGEFRALGAANIAAALSQGFVISGADSRTAVNDANGGQTQMVSVIAAATIALVMLVLTGPLAYVPQAALGVVLIYASLKLVDWRGLWSLRRYSRGEFLLALGTTVGVAFVGVMPGVGLAVTVAVLRFLMRVARPRESLLGVYPDRDSFHDLAIHPGAAAVPGMMVYRFESPLTFFNAAYFKHRVLALVDTAETPVYWLVIDSLPITQFDLTALAMLRELNAELAERGVTLAFAGRREEWLNWFRERGKTPDERLYSTLQAARRDFNAKMAGR